MDEAIPDGPCLKAMLQEFSRAGVNREASSLYTGENQDREEWAHGKEEK